MHCLMQIYNELQEILTAVFNLQNVVKNTNDRGIMIYFADNISILLLSGLQYAAILMTIIHIYKIYYYLLIKVSIIYAPLFTFYRIPCYQH